MKYPIIAFSFQHKRFSKLDLLTALGDWSGRKSRIPPPPVWRNSLAELAVLPGKFALQIGSFLSGLLILHQIIKLDPTNHSQLSLDRQPWLWAQLSSGQSPCSPENLFFPGIHRHLCCYPQCLPFGKCINATLRTKYAQRAALCALGLPAGPGQRFHHRTQSLGWHEIPSEYPDISSNAPVSKKYSYKFVLHAIKYAHVLV